MSSVVGHAAVRVAGFASSVVLARALGPADRGAVATLVVWTFTILGIGALAEVTPVAYFVARRGRIGANAGLAIAAISSVLLIPVGFVVNWTVFRGGGPVSIALANWYLLIIPFTMLANVFGGVIVAEGRIAAYWSTRAGGEILLVLAAATLAFSHRLTVTSYVMSAIAGTFLSLALSWWAAGAPGPSNFASERGPIREFGRYCGRVMSTTIPALLRLRLDQLAVSVALPLAVMGYYSVAFSWAMIVSVVGSGLSTVIVSRSVHVDSGEPGGIAAAVQRVRRAATLAILLAIAAAAAAPMGVPLLFGRDYAPAVGPAVVLSVAVGITVWKDFLHDLHRAVGRPATGVVPEIVGLVVAALILAPLIAYLGALGAAIASVVSYLSLVIAFHLRMRRQFPRGTRLLPGLEDARDLWLAARAYASHAMGR